MADETVPVETPDINQSLVEGTFEITWGNGKLSAKGLRLFLLALIVVVPAILVMSYLAVKNGSGDVVTRVYEIAMLVLVFFFGRASTGAKT
jgi:hypothetical protein